MWNRPEASAFIFVGGGAESHSGPERPSDVMNRDETFVAIQENGGDVEFLRRDAVAFLAVPAEMEYDDTSLAAGEIAVRLAITLDDGRHLDGRVRYQLPDAGRRLQDYLNQPCSFLPMECNGEVLLLNKRRIVSARPLDLEGERA